LNCCPLSSMTAYIVLVSLILARKAHAGKGTIMAPADPLSSDQSRIEMILPDC